MIFSQAGMIVHDHVWQRKTGVNHAGYAIDENSRSRQAPAGG